MEKTQNALKEQGSLLAAPSGALFFPQIKLIFNISNFGIALLKI